MVFIFAEDVYTVYIYCYVKGRELAELFIHVTQASGKSLARVERAAKITISGPQGVRDSKWRKDGKGGGGKKERDSWKERGRSNNLTMRVRFIVIIIIIMIISIPFIL